jgi:uncharacterized protein (TIGR02118 family)
MVKFLIFFKSPENFEQFENEFASRYVPAINAIPNVTRVTVSRGIGAPAGHAPYHIIHELCFETKDDMINALNSPEGRAAGAAVMSFAKDLVTMMFAEAWE